MAKPRVIVVDSDQHCGSQLGLMPPDGVETSDGNWFKPGIHLQHLWNEHQNYVDDAERIIKEWRERGATAHYVNLGDLTDGDHHNTHQIVGKELGSHIEAARNSLQGGFLQLGFDSLHFVTGTPAHVGPGGALEKSIARNIADAGYPVVRCPFQGNATLWPWMKMRVHDYLLDFRHHGRSGMREHTDRSYRSIWAYDLHGSKVNDGVQPPDLAIRAHKHRMGDSGPDMRGITRILSTGCWQYSSEWIASKSVETLPHFGGWIIVVTDDMRGPYDLWVRPFKYKHPEMDAHYGVWTP